MTPSVVVSVVSGGRSENLLAFLRSLYDTAQGWTDLRIAVTINGPDPWLEDQVWADARSAGWAERVSVLRNQSPRGFAANHNRVLRDMRAEYYLIANDDVVILEGAVGSLVRFLEEDGSERVAVASPQLLNADGSVQPSTLGFPTPWRMLLSVSGVRHVPLVSWAIGLIGRSLSRFGDGRSRYWSHDRMTLVDTVRGAFVLVRATAIDEVGPMDEVALVGGEETEWHRRMAERGWRVAFVPEASVVHLEKQTRGLDATLELEFLKGWSNYFERHGTVRQLLVIRVGAASLYALRWLVACFSRDAEARRIASEGIRLSRNVATGRRF